MIDSSDGILQMQHRIGGPGFRWKLALRRAASERASLHHHHGDDLIHAASNYLRMCKGHGREIADRKYPTLAAACGLMENEQLFSSLKISVLGNLPSPELASRLGAEQRAIDTSMLLFFDITNMTRASSWMNCHIFVPEARYGSKELAAKLKMAQFGGPVVVRALLDGQDKLPLDQAQQIIDQEMQLHAKLQAALEFDLDAQGSEHFVKNYLDYDLKRRELEFEREKFQLEFGLLLQNRKDEVGQEEVSSSDAANAHQVSEDRSQAHLRPVHQVLDDQLVA